MPASHPGRTVLPHRSKLFKSHSSNEWLTSIRELHRVLSVFLVALALAVWASAPAGAADMHQGKVVEVGVGKLTMTDMAGKNQHSHEVATDAAITCDGKACGLSD